MMYLENYNMRQIFLTKNILFYIPIIKYLFKKIHDCTRQILREEIFLLKMNFHFLPQNYYDSYYDLA